MLTKNLGPLLLSLCLFLPNHSLWSSEKSTTQEIVGELRAQTDPKQAQETLARIQSPLEYRDIYQMLSAGLNENVDYPIPNALVDRILDQFANISEGDMDAFPDSLDRVNNERFDNLAGFLSYLQHPEIEATGFVKIVSYLAQRHETTDAATKKRLIDAVYATEFYQSEDLMSESFREDVFTNVSQFFLGKDGVIDEDLADMFFQHISTADDTLLAAIVTGLHKDTIKYTDNQQALENIIANENCQKQCQGNVIQLVTYNEDIPLTDRDRLLMTIVERDGTSDYILGDATMACWDARVPLSNPQALLEAVQLANEYGPQAKLKVEQALRNMQQ